MSRSIGGLGVGQWMSMLGMCFARQTWITLVPSDTLNLWQHVSVLAMAPLKTLFDRRSMFWTLTVMGWSAFVRYASSFVNMMRHCWTCCPRSGHLTRPSGALAWEHMDLRKDNRSTSRRSSRTGECAQLHE